MEKKNAEESCFLNLWLQQRDANNEWIKKLKSG